MIICSMLAVAIVLYILSGYAPDRVLEPQDGNIYYWGIGKRILGSIRLGKAKKEGDKLPWWLSKIPLPKPFVVISPQMKWTQIISGLQRAKDRNRGSDNASKEPILLDKDSQEYFVHRDEIVPFLKIFEPVDYRIPVVTKDGYDLVMAISPIYEVINDEGPIGRPSFKMVGGLQLETKIAPWVSTKTLEEIRIVDEDTVKNGITLDGGTLEQFIDGKMKAFGCKTSSLALKIYYGETAKALFKQIQEGTEFDIKMNNQLLFEKLQEEERQTKLNDAKNAAAVAKIAIEAYTEPLGKLLDKVYTGETQVKSARKFVLVEANTEEKSIGAIAFEHMFEEIAKSTGANVGRKRREEESSNAS